MNDDSDDVTGKDRRAVSGAKPIKRKRLVVAKAPHEVGYARPPMKYRFKPGQSGNPSGRPKGAKNKPSREIEKIKGTFSKITGELITIRKGDRTVRMSKMEFILNSAVDKAAKGHAGMARYVIGLGIGIEQDEKRLHNEFTESAIAYKQYWSDELMYRRAAGIRGMPDPVPHPDHVLIDPDGTVSILGPVTPEEKKADDEYEAERDIWKARLRELDAEVNSLMEKLNDPRCNPHRVRKELSKARELRNIFENVLAETSREERYALRRYFPPTRKPS